ncbi:aldo/keto reductase [Aulographum hederae CBS 113979]|uniref:Aldo/keto reductase n=1 Tax=Aulographum hederae CBS 113979 TaxID=1176131 RepID=A0A6G1GZL1_9PEZI|nr:aldo/keto reductase [Aulographum hederae CBS 113979]
MIPVRFSTLPFLYPINNSSPPQNQSTQKIPVLGFGTWDLSGNTTEAVASAIAAGYRHLDCAKAYGNQKEVAEGIKEGMRRAGIGRGELWVTTKIWGNYHGSKIPEGHNVNLAELDLDYIDLVLMHFPVSSTRTLDYASTWHYMEGLVRENTARFIGISNFNVSMVETLLRNATIVPKVHQMELHPYLPQKDFIAMHKARNIGVTAYAPLGDTHSIYKTMTMSRQNRPPPLLENSVLKDIADARSCTVAQVALAWNMRRGVVVHPKTAQPERMRENFEAYKCKLTADDDGRIDAIEEVNVMRYWNICPTMLGQPCYTGLQDG